MFQPINTTLHGYCIHWTTHHGRNVGGPIIHGHNNNAPLKNLGNPCNLRDGFTNSILLRERLMLIPTKLDVLREENRKYRRTVANIIIHLGDSSNLLDVLVLNASKL